MSVRNHMAIWCDKCGVWRDCDHHNKRRCRQAFAVDGWSTYRDAKDRKIKDQCPRCKQKDTGDK